MLTDAHHSSPRDHMFLQSGIVKLLMFHQKPHDLAVEVGIVKRGLLGERKLIVDVYRLQGLFLDHEIGQLNVSIMDLKMTWKFLNDRV